MDPHIISKLHIQSIIGFRPLISQTNVHKYSYLKTVKYKMYDFLFIII